MFDILELRELTNKEAKAVWKAYTDKPFKVKGDILACDLAHEIEAAKSEYTRMNYLKDPKISKLEKVAKTIGF